MYATVSTFRRKKSVDIGDSSAFSRPFATRSIAIAYGRADQHARKPFQRATSIPAVVIMPCAGVIIVEVVVRAP